MEEDGQRKCGCSLTGDSFIRPHLRKLSPYQPILPFEVLSARLGRKPEDILKLDANENPYSPPPEVLEALGSVRFPYLYPDPESRRLRAALAEDSGLESGYILAGCGADELIDLIMRCVLDPGDKIVDCRPTFTMYEFDAAVNAATVIKVPRKSDFRLHVKRIVEVVEQEKPKCIFLTSPNTDGSVIDDEAFLKILNLPILVVLDEAYIGFSGIESKMRWVKKFENLIVLRTFRKRSGNSALGGLRVGYGASPRSLIEYLWRAKQPYNVSVAAETAACAALQNPGYLQAELSHHETPPKKTKYAELVMHDSLSNKFSKDTDVLLPICNGTRGGLFTREEWDQEIQHMRAQEEEQNLNYKHLQVARMKVEYLELARSSLSQIQNQIHNMMEQTVASGSGRKWDAKETADGLHLRMDLPGLGKEDVKVSMEQNTLIIKGERKNEFEDDETGPKYACKIDLPERLYKIYAIKTEMKNGVLKVFIPKNKEEGFAFD